MSEVVNDQEPRSVQQKRVLYVETHGGSAYNGRMMNAPRGRLVRWTLFVLCLGGCLAASSCLLAPPNRPPVVVVDANPREGYRPLPVTFNASASFDPDGQTLSIHWDLGDGTMATGATLEHSFRTPGVYHVVATAVDAEGVTASETIVIHVREVPEGYTLRRFSWERDGVPRDWEMLIPYELYQMYKGRLRIPLVDNYRYGDYVSDPLDDPTLEDYATSLWNRVGGDDDEFILETLAFVQGAIGYQADPTGTEHPLYPLETLADGVGDCEDTAILFVSLIQARGIPCKLAFVDTDGGGLPNHVLAFVAVSERLLQRLPCGAAGTTIQWDDRIYALAETAVDRGVYGLGCDPWGLGEDDVVEMWSFPEE